MDEFKDMLRAVIAEHVAEPDSPGQCAACSNGGEYYAEFPCPPLRMARALVDRAAQSTALQSLIENEPLWLGADTGRTIQPHERNSLVDYRARVLGLVRANLAAINAHQGQ